MADFLRGERHAIKDRLRAATERNAVRQGGTPPGTSGRPAAIILNSPLAPKDHPRMPPAASMSAATLLRAAGLLVLAAAAASGAGLLRPAAVVAPDAQWEEGSRAGRVYAEGVVAAKDG